MAHKNCRPPAGAQNVQRWTGTRWITDDGQTGLAFSGETPHTSDGGWAGAFPTAWATACTGTCGLTCVLHIAMSRTTQRFGAANGRVATPCQKKKNCLSPTRT